MNSKVEITAMSGAGNDFVVIHGAVADKLGERLVEWTRKVCQRGRSIGADGVLIVRPINRERVQVDFLNPDGSNAFCGNGSRCAARYAVRAGMADSPMILQTEIGEIPAVVLGGRGNQVRLTLPAATDHGERIIPCDGHEHRGRFVTAGIPHFVCEVDNLELVPLESCAPQIRRHPSFGPAGTNVNFVTRRNDQIQLRTFERGVEGETLCCGSGAVAVAFALHQPLPRDGVSVLPASGIGVEVGSADEAGGIWLTGEARVLYDAVVDPEAWLWGV
jgi:diaminopimelate epimerase